MKRETLEKIKDKKLSYKKGYKELFPKAKKARKSHFIKLRITINGERKVTRLLKVLFALPIPVGLAKIFLRKQVDTEFLNLLNYKGIRITVDTKDTYVLIKTI